MQQSEHHKSRPTENISCRQTHARDYHSFAMTGIANSQLFTSVPERDPKDDPEPQSFNQRQLWFLEQIRMGERFSAKEIVQTWHVSLKTARRDISALLHSKLLEYIGSRRKGRYRTNSR